MTAFYSCFLRCHTNICLLICLPDAFSLRFRSSYSASTRASSADPLVLPKAVGITAAFCWHTCPTAASIKVVEKDEGSASSFSSATASSSWLSWQGSSSNVNRALDPAVCRKLRISSRTKTKTKRKKWRTSRSGPERQQGKDSRIEEKDWPSTNGPNEWGATTWRGEESAQQEQYGIQQWV